MPVKSIELFITVLRRNDMNKPPIVDTNNRTPLRRKSLNMKPKSATMKWFHIKNHRKVLWNISLLGGIRDFRRITGTTCPGCYAKPFALQSHCHVRLGIQAVRWALILKIEKVNSYLQTLSHLKFVPAVTHFIRRGTGPTVWPVRVSRVNASFPV